jgi:glycosyltransferase involved in cell wall biosynthesis
MLSVLVGHNYYRTSSPSGENVVFEAETALLEANGHRVTRYIRRSDDITARSTGEHLKLFAQAAWSYESYAEIKRALVENEVEIAHFHNIFPLITISALRACRDTGVPVVLTLHNYRPLCVNGQFVRDGSVCEACLNRRVLWPGAAHRCYRDSFAYSAAMTVIQALPRIVGTWWRDVDVFIAPSDFLRRKYISAGFPATKISVKPYFVASGAQCGERSRDYALFVGRLSSEKGVRTLLSAWTRLSDIPLLVVGDGPQRQQLQSEAAGLRNIRFLGKLSNAEVLDYLRGARFLVVPSEWYENLPMVILEALTCGTPVIASNLGALPEIIANNHNGILFEKGDAQDLARKAEHLWRHPNEARLLGTNARHSYEQHYTAEANYRQLIGQYAKAAESGS